jgi:hypothetical protein
MSIDRIVEWLIVFVFIFGLAYTAIVIKNEYEDFRDSAVDFDFFNFRFYLPTWWTKISQSSDHHQLFKRTDTHYDWQAEFHLLKNSTEQTAQQILEDFLTQESLVFDPEVKTTSEADHFFTQTKTKELNSDFIRQEGTATQDNENRLYLDLMVYINELDPDQALLFISKSSVLSGGIEGPYVEMALKNLEIID